jgi:hypothetical protein
MQRQTSRGRQAEAGKQRERGKGAATQQISERRQSVEQREQRAREQSSERREQRIESQRSESKEQSRGQMAGIRDQREDQRSGCQCKRIPPCTTHPALHSRFGSMRGLLNQTRWYVPTNSHL